MTGLPDEIEGHVDMERQGRVAAIPFHRKIKTQIGRHDEVRHMQCLWTM
jgi:hypothetical protein